jgi:ferredoxin-type protein NapF
MAAISRMDFLRGALKGRKDSVRPPWAADPPAFTTLCDGCGHCMRACKSHIVVAGRGGLPEIDFRRGACTFCGDCVAACPTGALSRIKMSVTAPWTLVPEIDGACLAKQGVVCRTCGDRCEPRAITFRLAPGGVARPVIDAAECTGCGECVAACPVQAIALANAAATIPEHRTSDKRGALA